MPPKAWTTTGLPSDLHSFDRSYIADRRHFRNASCFVTFWQRLWVLRRGRVERRMMLFASRYANLPPGCSGAHRQLIVPFTRPSVFAQSMIGTVGISFRDFTICSVDILYLMKWGDLMCAS